jgi:biotin synthase-related radical SAM superfamily protein
MISANLFLKIYLLHLNISICILVLEIKNSINKHIMKDKQKSDYVGFALERATINAFKKLCESRGSNISVELRRFIYNELKENGK